MLVYLGVFLVSCVVLGLELVLMRSLSIGHWHHFAYMIISVALLGFGLSGTVVALARRALLRNARTWMGAASLLLAGCLPVCFHLIQDVPFNVLELGWNAWQYLYLLEDYVLCLLPFFFGACVIALALAEPDVPIGSRYAVNLLGSGLGAVAFVLLMHLFDIPGLMRTLTTLAAAAAVLFALSHGRRLATTLTLAVALLVSGLAFLSPFEVRISEFKTLSHYHRLEAQHEARTIARRFSPLARIDVIESPRIHETPPGVSLNFTGTLPPQRLLIFDGESASVVNQIDGDLSRVAFLDQTTQALPYRLLDRPKVAVVGPGGGGPVLLARLHGASSVTAVELDANVIELMRGPLHALGGDVYDAPGVTVICAEGRSFFETTGERFDLIDLALVDSLAASAAGTNALNESYLYTVEAFRTYLRRLTDDGMLSVTRWLKLRPVPARDVDDPSDRMEATDVAKLMGAVSRALLSEDLEPARCIAVIRSWATATVLVRRKPFLPEELARVRAFADEHAFDLVYLPDIRRDEANRHTVLKQPVYYEAARALITGDAGRYVRDHPFAVEPATDSRPYFFDFFRWRLLVPLLRSAGTDWVPFVDWGYVALVATLVQATVLGLLLIVVPLVFLKRGGGSEPQAIRPHAAVVLGYFLCLGVAFMFLEMSTIQRMIRFLWHPVYSVAVVVTGFLVFAGVGSAAAERMRLRPVRKIAFAVTGILTVAVAHQTLLPVVMSAVAKTSFAVRVAVALAGIAPLAFLMGVLFPTGLSVVARTRPHLVPWAWGVNGCASVVATVLATLLAVGWGFQPVTWLAVGAYLAAALLARPLMRGVAQN